MPVRTCDVLIVGGGPAGATCAWQLVRAGLDVMVLDKQTFPRNKVCAGWITPAVIESLQLDCADYARERVMQPIRGFATGMIAKVAVETRFGEAVSFGVRRCEFDDYLLQRSRARLRLGEPLKTMVRDGGMWLVNGEISTPLVIGAGGHFCPVSHTLGGQLGHAERVVAAQEIEFAFPAGERRLYGLEDDLVQFFFCADLKGYGWCFVKGDYVNIGLGREDSHKLAGHVEQFCDWLRQRGTIPRNLPGKFNGHAYLLYPASRRALTHDGALLIGDAAGLAYAQSGEGIRPAVESALMAAAVVVDAAGDYRQRNLKPYVRQVVQRFGKRNSVNGAAALPARFRQQLAAKLMASPWFARHIVIERWFLHRGQPVIPAR